MVRGGPDWLGPWFYHVSHKSMIFLTTYIQLAVTPDSVAITNPNVVPMMCSMSTGGVASLS